MCEFSIGRKFDWCCVNVASINRAQRRVPAMHMLRVDHLTFEGEGRWMFWFKYEFFSQTSGDRMFSLTYKGVIFFPELYDMKEVLFFSIRIFSQLIFLQYIQFFFRNQSVGFFIHKSPTPPPKSQMVGLLLQTITAKIY